MTYRRTDTDPEVVDRLTFVLLAEDGTAYGYADGRPELPCGQVRGRREHVPVELTKLPAEDLAARLDMAGETPIVDGIVADGTFLDLGCANGGHLVDRRLLVSHYVTAPEPTARDLVAARGFPIAGGSGPTVRIDR